MSHAPFFFCVENMADENENGRIYVAAKGIVMNDGKPLILRRSDWKKQDGGDWWEFPGGTMIYGETPEQTLVREMKEETGLCVTPVKLLYAWTVKRPGNCQVVILTYFCNCMDMSQVRLSEEHTGFLWADSAQMREMLGDDIIEALDANNVWNILETE